MGQNSEARSASRAHPPPPLFPAGVASCSVNDGRSLNGGKSLAVIARGVPLPCGRGDPLRSGRASTGLLSVWRQRGAKRRPREVCATAYGVQEMRGFAEEAGRREGGVIVASASVFISTAERLRKPVRAR